MVRIFSQTASMFRRLAMLVVACTAYGTNIAHAHTEEAQFFGDQIPDPELPWWEAQDWYGGSVSIHGDTAAVSAAHEGGNDVGYIYIYVRDGAGAWTQQAKISNPGAQANFGNHVSLYNDTLLAAGVDAGDYQGTGDAFIFVRSGTTWSLQATLTGDSNDMDGFGYTGALHEDTAAVASWHDDDQGKNTGAVHIFVRNGTTWTREAKLYPSDADVNDHFGRAVDIEGDTLAVNSMLDLNPAGLYAGNVYMFVRENGVWVEQAKLEASDGNGADNMGVSVDINGDYVLAGALGDDVVGATNRGSAYVFRRNNCTWIEDAKLEPNEVSSNMLFGEDVAIQGDIALIGAEGDEDLGSNTGAAYVFSRSTGSWVFDSKINPVDSAAGLRFGASIDLDNDRGVIGANPGIPGKAYMFDLDTDNLAFPPQESICFDGCHP
jgi:hypothetical protein